MIFLQVFSHCAFMLSLPGLCMFFFISHILFNPGIPRLFSLPHHHTTYLSSSSLSAFFQSLLLNLPPPSALSHKHCHLYSKYQRFQPTQHTNYHLTSTSCVIHHIHTTISPPLLEVHNAHTLPSHNAYSYTSLYVSPTTHLHYYY